MAIAALESIELPGCGVDSNCARATNSRWGKLPVADWPLSFAGFAFFQAIAATLILTNGKRLPLLRVAMLAGGAISLTLLAVMISGGYVCGYCVTVHAANLVLILSYELAEAQSTPVRGVVASTKATLCFFGVLSVTTGLLAGLDHYANTISLQTAQSRLESALSAALNSDEASTGGTAVFQPGRYILGPEHASVHLTVVSDYQCASCRRFDELLHAILASRNDLSVSVRHFPFCMDCNEHIDKTRHANACRAAVAAEAAGIVGGSDAFWSTHEWLFKHAGQFTDEELLRWIRNLNIDEDRFRKALADEATAELVLADTAAADQAGLRYTPTIFINGQKIDLRK